MKNVHKNLKKLLDTFTKNPTRIFSRNTLEAKELELQELVDILILFKPKDSSEIIVKNEAVEIVNSIRKRIRTQKDYLTNDCRDIVLYKIESKNNMSALIPLPNFFKDGEDFENFVDSLEFYFTIADTNESKKKDLLAYLLGSNLKKVKDFIAPVDISTKNYADLVDACKSTFSSGLKKQQAYVKFFILKQSNEKGSEFAQSVKAVAKIAEINDQILIVNRIIEGLKDQKIKYELLKQKIVVFSELVTQLTFLEMINEASSPKVDENVNKIKFSKNSQKYDNNKNKNNKKGEKNKEKKNSKKGTCNYCKKPGHWKAQCYKLKNKTESKKPKTNKESDLSQNLGSLYLDS